MELPRLATLAVLLVASLGSTGCYGYRRSHARYVYVPVRPRVVVAGEVAAPGYAAYAAPPEAPPPPAAPPPAPAAYGPQPIVVRTHGPGTTIIIVNPPSDRPAVGIVQGAPPPMAAPPSPYYAPAPPAAPRVHVVPAPPAAPQPEDQGGWNE